MFKQVILLNLQDKCFGPNLDTIKNNMKTSLEALNGTISGMERIEVHSDCCSSSNADVIVEAIFDSEDSYRAFTNDESYKKATKEVVVPFIDNRTHVEFEM